MVTNNPTVPGGMDTIPWDQASVGQINPTSPGSDSWERWGMLTL